MVRTGYDDRRRFDEKHGTEQTFWSGLEQKAASKSEFKRLNLKLVFISTEKYTIFGRKKHQKKH